MAGKSSQMVPDMFNDLLSLNLRGGAAMMKNIYSGKKLCWGMLSVFISKGRHLSSCEELLFVLLSSKNKSTARTCVSCQDPACFGCFGVSFVFWVFW